MKYVNSQYCHIYLSQCPYMCASISVIMISTYLECWAGLSELTGLSRKVRVSRIFRPVKMFRIVISFCVARFLMIVRFLKIVKIVRLVKLVSVVKIERISRIARVFWTRAAEKKIARTRKSSTNNDPTECEC